MCFDETNNVVANENSRSVKLRNQTEIAILCRCESESDMNSSRSEDEYLVRFMSNKLYITKFHLAADWECLNESARGELKKTHSFLFPVYSSSLHNQVPPNTVLDPDNSTSLVCIRHRYWYTVHVKRAMLLFDRLF